MFCASFGFTHIFSYNEIKKKRIIFFDNTYINNASVDNSLALSKTKIEKLKLYIGEGKNYLIQGISKLVS